MIRTVERWENSPDPLDHVAGSVRRLALAANRNVWWQRVQVAGTVVLAVLVAALWVQNRQQSQRAAQSRALLRAVAATQQAVLDCTDPHRTNSSCQRYGDQRQTAAVLQVAALDYRLVRCAKTTDAAESYDACVAEAVRAAKAGKLTLPGAAASPAPAPVRRPGR